MKFLVLITVKASARPSPEVVLKHKEWVLQQVKSGAMERHTHSKGLLMACAF